MENHQKGIGYAVLTAVMWAVLAIGLKVAVERVDAVTIVWLRFTIAFACLLGYQLYYRPASLRQLIRPPMALILAAVFLAGNYLGFMLGVEYTGPSNAQVIIQLGPVMLALSGFVFFRERVSRLQLAGFILAAVGMIIFYEHQLSLVTGDERQFSFGVVLTVSGALAWTVYAVFQKKLVLQFRATTLNIFIFGLASVLYLPFVRFSSLTNLSWGFWLLLLFLGLNTLISYGALNLALRYTDTSKVSIILILNPVLTVALMTFLTRAEVSWIAGEHFNWLSMLGALIILAGAFLVVRRK
ncbi:MAG: DMT family transporter [Mangrovibacterium sp.]